MKKVLALLLALAMVFGLAACGEKEQTETNTSKLGSEPVTITFWHSASDDAGVLMDKYVKEFNEKNEYQITVNAIFQGQYADSTTMLKSIISAENYSELPDVMQMDATGKVEYYNSGKALTVDAAMAKFNDNIIGQYPAGALGNWQFSGAQLGLPYSTSTTITFYNKDILKAAGWDHCPDTFADIIKLDKDIKAAGLKDSQGNPVSTFGTIPNSPTLANWIGQLGSYIVNKSNGADATADKLEMVDSGALKTFLTEWKAMYDAGALKNESLSTTQFVAGQVAIFTSSTSNVGSVLSKVDGAFEVGASTYLRVNDKADYGATVSGAMVVLFDTGNDLKEQAAWEFMKYLTGAEVQADLAVNTGYIPGCTAAQESEAYKALLASNPLFAVGPEQLAKTPASMRSITVGPTVDFYYAIQDCVSGMLTNNATVDDTVKTMSEQLQLLLDDYKMSNPDMFQ